MEHYQKQEPNLTFGNEIFVRHASDRMSLLGAPSAPTYHTFKHAEYAEHVAATGPGWFGLARGDLAAICELARGTPQGVALSTKAHWFLTSTLDVSLVHVADGRWRIAWDESLEIAPVGTLDSAVTRTWKTPIDRNPLARALANGESKARVRAAKKELEAERKRRRGAAEAKLEGIADEDWEAYCRMMDEANARTGAAR